jgi:hypothetical protein
LRTLDRIIRVAQNGYCQSPSGDWHELVLFSYSTAKVKIARTDGDRSASRSYDEPSVGHRLLGSVRKERSGAHGQITYFSAAVS